MSLHDFNDSHSDYLLHHILWDISYFILNCKSGLRYRLLLLRGFKDPLTCNHLGCRRCRFAFTLLVFGLLLSTKGNNRKHRGSNGIITVANVIKVVSGVAGTRTGVRVPIIVFMHLLQYSKARGNGLRGGRTRAGRRGPRRTPYSRHREAVQK